MDNTIDTLKIKIQGKDESAESTLDKVISKLEQIQSAADGSSNSVGSLSNKLGSLKSTVNNLKSKNFKNFSSSTGKTVSKPQQISEKIKSNSSLNGTEKLTVSNESISKASKFSNKISDIKDKFDSASSKVKTFGFHVKSAFSDSIVGRFGNKVKSLITAFGRIALYRIMRSMIKQVTDAFSTGINNMYQYSKTFNGDFSKNMDSAASSLLTFKNSIGAVMAPIINLVVPWLDKIVDKVIEINNTIAMVIAGLTGKSTYSKAVRVTTEYAAAADQAADNTSKVTNKVEELKRSLAGLDEITIIGDNSNTNPLSSSNSGDNNVNNGTDYGSMFVEAPVDMEKINKIKDTVNDIWNIFKKIWDVVVAIGLAIAAWKVAKSLFDLSGLNSGLTLAGLTLTFVGATLLFKGIKNVITDGMNWENFWTLFFGASAVTAGTTILGKVISRVTGNTNWTGIGARIGAGIGGAAMLFSGLYDTLTNTLDNNKGTLESTLTSYFSSVIGGALIGTAISPGIGTAIGAVAGAVIDGIAFVVSNPESMNKIEVALQSGELAKNVETGFTYELIKEFGMDVETASTLSRWWTNLWVQPLQDTYSWFAEIPERAKQAYTNCWIIWLYAYSWVKQNISDPIRNLIAGFPDYVSNKSKEAYNSAWIVWLYAYSWFKQNITDPIENLFENLWTGIKRASTSAVNWIIDKIEGGINGMISGINWFIDKFNSIGKWASNVTGMTFYYVNEVQPVSLSRVSFKEGGFPEDGMFFANHNELVGQFSNGKTAVANNEQIIEGIAGGVASANEEQNTLLREQNRLLRLLLDKDNSIDVGTIASAFSRKNQRDGKVTVPVAL